MKKAKFIITAVALFAVIGGTLAFKATKFNGRPLYYTTTLLNIGGVTYQTLPGQPAFCAFKFCFATVVGTPVVNPSTSTRLSGDPLSTMLTNTVLNQTVTIPYVRCTTTAPISCQSVN